MNEGIPQQVPIIDTRRLDWEIRLKEIEDRVLEHKVRLDNGIHVMAELKQSIAVHTQELRDLERASAPKPVDWWKIFVPVTGLLVTILTGWWALSEKFSSRPTMDQMRDLIHIYTATVEAKIDANQQDIKALKDELRLLRQKP